MARYSNILETIGNTPMVRLNKLAPAGVNVYVKIEAFNPMSSVKDRMARAVIERAEETGALKPGQTVVEAPPAATPASGSAMVCAAKGYPLVVTMAESFSIERRKLLRFLGAKVVLTPAAEKGSGMLAKAVELAEKHGWFLCRQFENEANADVHSRTTAREILSDFDGESLDYWVTGFGTGGTLKGVSRVLRKESPNTRIIAAEPDNAQVLASGIPQQRKADGAPAGSHPRFRPHLMQGWAPDFISKLTEDALGAGNIDEIVPVAGNDALKMSRELARQEGIFVGTSSGATLAAALEIARRSPPGTNIVCMLPDTGERYMSTPLFETIGEDMTAEELEISRSTPSCRFDAPDGGSASAACGRSRGGRARSRRSAFRHRHRARRAGGDVRARVVRVLLVGAQAVRANGCPLSQRGSRLRRVSATAIAAERFARCSLNAPACSDDPADLHRRSAHRRLHGRCSTPGGTARFRSAWPSCGVAYDRERLCSIRTACCRSGCILARPHEGTRS